MYYNENDPDEVWKAKKTAQNLRYKKSIAKGFNWQDIYDELQEWVDDCEEIRWTEDCDIDALIEAMDGDEEEAFEFRMLYSELSSEAERLLQAVTTERTHEYFDVFFAAVAYGSVRIIGYDSYEDDYFNMTSYEQSLAKDESEKKLLRLTKSELIATARQCFGFAAAVLNFRYKADYLQAAMDVLKSKNHAYIESVKSLGSLYEAADKDKWDKYADSVRQFNEAVDAMPDRVWFE